MDRLHVSWGCWCRGRAGHCGGPVTWLGVRSQIGMIPRPVFMVDGRVTWVVRLVKIGADGEEQRGDVVWIARPGDLAKPGLTMAEGKVVRAGLQKKFVAWQSQDWSGQAAIAACGS